MLIPCQERIDETLDCLNGAQWFTSLDLKSGYWQVELDEDSKALTAFTVEPLSFYQCEVHALWSHKCASYIPKVDGIMPRRHAFEMGHYLFG